MIPLYTLTASCFFARHQSTTMSRPQEQAPHHTDPVLGAFLRSVGLVTHGQSLMGDTGAPWPTVQGAPVQRPEGTISD